MLLNKRLAWDNQKGFTLVEVMVAVMLIAIVLIFVVSSLSNQIYIIGIGKDRQLAISMAQELAENLISAYDEVYPTKVIVFKNDIKNKYNFDLEFTPVEDSAYPGLRKANLSISKKTKLLTSLDFLIYDR